MAVSKGFWKLVLNACMKHIIIIILYVCVLFSCGNNVQQSGKNATTEKSGETIFEVNCTVCHGTDGRKQVAGAKDLSLSLLNPEAQKNIIKNGKGGMAAYKAILSDQEIDRLVEHIQTLKTTVN